MDWNDVEQLYEAGGFCPDGWTGISSTTKGEWRMCCYNTPVGGTIFDTGILDHLNHPERKRVRLAMLANDEEFLRTVCKKCYYQQDNGLVSRRDRVMMNYQGLPWAQDGLIRSLQTMAPDGTIEINYIHMLDIKFIGNQCNLKCYTCGPQNSSSLGVEGRAMGDLPSDYQPVQVPFSGMSVEMTEQFWKDFRAILPFLKVINFTGGEPFMMNAYWDMIDLAIQSGHSQHMELHLSSNVSAIKWDRGNIMDCFSSFRRVRLQASIDSHGEYNDYIRYPSEYQALVDNISRIRDEQPQVDIVVSSVASALSVRGLPRLNQDMLARDFTHIFTNVLEHPDYQKIEYLPDFVKTLYLSTGRYDGAEWEGIKTLLGKPESPDKHRVLIRRCKALDKYRGTDAEVLWPEFEWNGAGGGT